MNGNPWPNVAFVGLMGSGKTTLANELAARLGYKRFAWADPIRRLFAEVYDVDVLDSALYPQVKDRVYETTDPDGFIVERTGRQILQLIGTEAFRERVDRDFWIKAGLNRIAGDDGPWANDDTRFVNEAEALRQRGFVIVRVSTTNPARRERLGDVIASAHASETEQARIKADLTLWNTGTVEDAFEFLTEQLPLLQEQVA